MYLAVQFLKFLSFMSIEYIFERDKKRYQRLGI